MLSKPDRSALMALNGLNGHPQFESIISWLEMSLVDLRHANDTCKDEVLMRWHQGACQTLEEIISTYHSCRDLMTKLR